ncbi:MAG: TRAP transporter small permease subunit [bacterium]|nr:MAG: TRAP transporter small permease subunit [bacterium]
MSRFFTVLFAGGASLSMMGLFIIILFNSLRRYTFGKSLAWGEELPVFIAVHGFMFGAAYAYMQDRHVRFTVLVAFLPRALVGKLYMILDIIMVGVGGLLAWSGWQFVLKRGAMETSALISLAKDIRDATGWEWIIWLGLNAPYQAAMVMGGAMLSVAALIRLLERRMEGEGPAGADSSNTRPVEG